MNLFPDPPTSRLSDEEIAARVEKYFADMDRLRESLQMDATHEVVCRGRSQIHYALDEAIQAASIISESWYGDAVVYQLHPRAKVFTHRWSGTEQGVRIAE